MSLTMTGLNPGLLVHEILLFALMNLLVVLTFLLVVLANPLIVSVSLGLVFLS